MTTTTTPVPMPQSQQQQSETDRASQYLATSAPSSFTLPLRKDTSSSSSQLAIKIQLFPHSDRPTNHHHHSRENNYTAFSFIPVEKDLKVGDVVRIGRKVDRHHTGKSRRGDRSNNVATGEEEFEFALGSPPVSDVSASSKSDSIIKKTGQFIAFRSKVVSRTHAELWLSQSGQLLFRDVGSSSGTFLNRLRLSPSGKESLPYPLKSGDVIQLGVDYQGRQEEIYKCVMIKIFTTIKTKSQHKPNPTRLRDAVRSLISAMNPTNTSLSSSASSDCCICLNAISPYQALFLAPCSHCFHYKCVTPLLGTNYMFLCPMCRQVANLEASVAEDDQSFDDPPSDTDSEIKPSGASIRSAKSGRSKVDVESRVRMFLEEVESPVPRVTANDLDALLSDGEGGASSSSTSNAPPLPDISISSPPDSLSSPLTLARPSKDKMGPIPVLARHITRVNRRPSSSALSSQQQGESSQIGGMVGFPSSSSAKAKEREYREMLRKCLEWVGDEAKKEEIRRVVGGGEGSSEEEV